ncbi:S8 family serine peptidase [Lysobacter cavernae]|uniref:S8 family serine peptidase n=1 Tax=Lysobacter cavernae TaxID=1685901 RepID=A0ABV7RW90_9GAMM
MRSVLLCTVVLGLGACGGGGGGNVRSDPPPAVVPPPQPSAPVVLAPNPGYGKHLAVTNASAAHQAGITGKGVRIGVLDSGVMRTHPALSPRVVANLNYVTSPPNNLQIDDVAQHGTAVSQIMAGSAFGAWPGGIAPGAEIVSARILDDKDPPDDGTGQGNEVSGALGLKPIHQALINNGVRVMNNSWGGLYWTNPAATAPIADEYRPFIQSNGGLVVFATGNESMPNPSSMAALPSQPGVGGSLPAADLERGWIAVTAINPDSLQLDSDRNGAVYANACGVAMHYCLAAPGTVTVTGTNDGPTSPSYWNWKGTSLAAPIVSGAAALVWEAFPYFNNDLVRQTLLGTAQDLGAFGVDAIFGYGLLDVGKAVKGPARLDWGDVTVTFDGITSTWANSIRGTGGITKRGTGTLVLGPSFYTGTTRVEGGTVRPIYQLYGGASVAQGARLELANVSIDGSLENLGTAVVTGGAGHLIMGNFHQGAAGQLQMQVGSRITVSGLAQIDGGDLSIIGKVTGYTHGSTETLISTTGGVTGAFNSLSRGPGVLLEGALRYSANQVMLDITRLEVTAVAQSFGLAPASLSSAERVEGAFDAIDAGMINEGQGSTEFIAGAGAIQGVASASAVEQTLSSLSGELHNADAQFALMAIESNRYALESRVDALQSAPLDGAWAQGLKSQRAMSRFDVDANGWMLGHDRRYGAHLTFGAALSETDGYAWHDLRGDRERNRQVEGQLYASWNTGGSYLLGSLAVGRMQRWMQREILLGGEAFRVDSDYAHRYSTLGLQAGHHFDVSRAQVTPYLGAQVLRLDRDGFSEQGAAGFGLSATDSSLSATQALMGARFAHDWRLGQALWTLQGRVEWQHLLSQSGGDIAARFTALDVWSPIVGGALDRDVGVFGLGLSTRLGRGGQISFDVDGRHESGETYTRAMATWSVAY